MDLRRQLFKKAVGIGKDPDPDKRNVENVDSSYSSLSWEDCFESSNVIAVGESVGYYSSVILGIYKLLLAVSCV